jgi:hypothetical protein
MKKNETNEPTIEEISSKVEEIKMEVTEEVVRDSRASDNREAVKRPVVWKEPNALDAPAPPDGFRHRWIRAESLGFDDTKNIAGKLRSGYELVRADEYQATNFPVVGDGKYKGVIGVGGLLLARIPEEVAEARAKFYADKSIERADGIKNDLLKDQHPSMPISYDSRSSKSFGGK